MALLLDGVAEYLTVVGPRNQFRNLAAATVCVWVRADIPPPTNRVCMKWSTNTGGNTTRVSLGLTTTLAVELGARALDTDGLSTVTVASVFTQGPWQHLAAIYDFSAGIGLLYVNGGASVSAVTFASMTKGNTSDTASLTGGIGGANVSPGNGFWPGAIDDLRIYQRALGADEIVTIYAAKGVDNIVGGLAGRWPLRELGENVAVSAAADVTGLGGLATPVSTPVYTPGITRGRRRTRAAVGHP